MLSSGMVDFRVDTSGATQSLLSLGERNIFLFPFFLDCDINGATETCSQLLPLFDFVQN